MVGSLNGTNLGGLLTLIDVKNQRILSQTNAPSNAVVSIAMDADANTVYAGTVADDDKKSELLIWDRKANKTRTLLRNEGYIWCVAISKNHKLVFVGGNEKIGDKESSIIVWDPVAGKIVKTFVRDQKTINKFAISSDDAYLASGDIDGNVLLWKLPTMAIVGKASTAGSSEIKLLKFVKNELFVGTADGTIRKFRIDDE